MKRKPRRNVEPASYPEPTTPKIKKSDQERKPLTNVSAELMQRLAHNAILWCDHDGGTVLDKAGNPFSAYLEMENTVSPERQKKFAEIFKRNTPDKDLSDDEMQERAYNAGIKIDFKTKDKIQAHFRYQTSPYSNGNLNFAVWYKDELVLYGYDVPGPVYQYPSENIKVTVYKSGPWEKFLLDKKYDKTHGKTR